MRTAIGIKTIDVRRAVHTLTALGGMLLGGAAAAAQAGAAAPWGPFHGAHSPGAERLLWAGIPAAGRIPSSTRAGAAATDPRRTPEVPPEVQARAVDSLDALLAYPLDGEQAVPRLEMSAIPDAYGDITATDRRKEVFLRMLLPLVLLENERLERLRDRLRAALDTPDGLLEEDTRGWLRALAREYRVDGDPLASAAAREDLLRRVDVVPPSLALAQAAIESGWGRSRFAREGRNLFGIWTWDASKGIRPRQRQAGKTHQVRRFDSLRESVRYYLHTLNSHSAYATLRETRTAQRARGEPLDSLALAEGLLRYSEKGREYVRLIQELIRYNDLAGYDRARLAAA